jgi:hypothetical protein
MTCHHIQNDRIPHSALCHCIASHAASKQQAAARALCACNSAQHWQLHSAAAARVFCSCTCALSAQWRTEHSQLCFAQGLPTRGTRLPSGCGGNFGVVRGGAGAGERHAL